MFDSFIVPPKPDIDPKLPGYRKLLLRYKRGLLLTYSLAFLAWSIYNLLFRLK
jgi:hypothetical protein